MGEIFNRWRVVGFAGRDKRSETLWDCLCECGNVKIVPRQALVSGGSSSCGCYKADRIREVHARFLATDECKAGRAARKLNKRIWNSEYKSRNPLKIAEYQRIKCQTDIQFKLKARLRTRLGNAINGNQKKGSAVNDLGCTIGFLKSRIESLWKDGMSWENWSPKGWHIDHIKPLANFDLTDYGQLKSACHYSNLQPLWWYENFEKSDKFQEAI